MKYTYNHKKAEENRHRPLTYRGLKEKRSSVEDMLSFFSINGFIPDDEFAADMQLLVSGQMTPEEHRAYLKAKYEPQQEAKVPELED